MAAITTRAGKGTPLTNTEMDANFNNLNSGKVEKSGDTFTGTMAAQHMNPSATGTYDLGSTAARWRNIYTNDLHLSNGIGDYTVVEGEDDLFLYNNLTGKVFKFALIEVNPADAPAKAEHE